ncbi:MAG: Tfp pilus assembly protein PilB, type IV pilus assembly protein PilB [Parcubacteria group bacterium GW2011_GWC1_43_61]|nr:MAG: Tfp pilus assembly protein PilB, type IV pilus assembly protein PilB [Parcubacteria group bacterium GW2011_GWC1_43_61]
MFKGEEKQEDLLIKVRRREEEARAKLLAEKMNFPYLDLAFIPIETDALKLIPREKAEKANAAAINIEAKTLRLAVSDPENPAARLLIKELQVAGYSIKIFIVSETGLKKALSHYPPPELDKEITGQVQISNNLLSNFQKQIIGVKDLKTTIAGLFEAKTSQIIEALLAGALILKASDIHLEPEEATVRIRLRLDGVLEDVIEKAQDGRFSVISDDINIEIRTSALPGAYGENIVMRILDPRVIKIDVDSLGIREDDLEIINKELQRPTGMILTTGPTGSGKTTTLYAFIKKILTSDIKIITIEDPIEYRIDGISQTQVEPDKGYTFENGLRSIVRQDPDVILVGEIRDYETAEIAAHAALTGHLVFSTLHTNDAIGAIPRLIDLGIKPPVIAPAINLLMAQRLLRTVCKKCATKRPLTEAETQNFKKILNNLPPRVDFKFDERTTILEARGCENCHNGYLGRAAIVELFKVDDTVERLILESPTEAKLRESALKSGMVTMTQDAVIKITNGTTTIEEVERVMGKMG